MTFHYVVNWYLLTYSVNFAHMLLYILTRVNVSDRLHSDMLCCPTELLLLFSFLTAILFFPLTLNLSFSSLSTDKSGNESLMLYRSMLHLSF